MRAQPADVFVMQALLYRKLKNARIPFIVVARHSNYYPRFGFRPASNYG
jgi:predicted N-acetyltransferase YhbS